MILTWPEATREEIRIVIQFIVDSLTTQELGCDVSQVEEENPDCWMVVCDDKAGYRNAMLIGWNVKDNRILMTCYDQSRARHDELESVPEEDSKCWFVVPAAEHAVLHLNGRIRELAAEYRARKLAEESETEDA